MIETPRAPRPWLRTKPVLALAILPLCFGALCLGVGCRSGDEPTTVNTDIFLAPIRAEGGGAWLAGPPIRVTNRDEYDNQPTFSQDGQLLLLSSRRGPQADIYVVDLSDPARIRNQRPDRWTQTLESEYSPAAIPGGSQIAVIRVERDGRQRIWALGEEDALLKPVVPVPDYVGYQAWVDADTLAVYALGDPPTLHTVSRTGAEDAFVVSPPLAEGIGRSLQPIPGKRAVSFVLEGADGLAWIHELDLDTGEHRPLVEALPGAEHHAWLPDGDLLMAQGSAILRWGPGTLGLWAELVNYADEDIQGISRLAVDPAGEKLAFVAHH